MFLLQYGGMGMDTAGEFGSQLRHQEQMSSLKRLYDERVRHLRERIKSTYHDLKDDDTINALKRDPDNAEFVQQRMKEMVEDSLANEREAQVEGLMQKVASLEAREHDLVRALEAKESSFSQSLQALRSQLATGGTPQPHQYPQSPPRGATLTRTPGGTVSPGARPAPPAEQFQELVTELQSLQQVCAAQRADLENLQSECEDYKRRYEMKVRERGATQDEMLASAQREQELQTNIRDKTRELGECQQRLRHVQGALEQSEKDRLEIRQKYVEVGEKFERFIQQEERENSETVQLLVKKVKAAKTRLAQYKKDRIKSMTEISTLKNQLIVSEQERENLLIQIKSKIELERRVHVLEADNQAKAREQEHLMKQLALAEARKDQIPLEKHQSILQDRLTTLDSQHQSAVRMLQDRFDLQVKEKIREAEERKQSEFSATLSQIRRGVQALEAARDEEIRQRKTAQEEADRMRAAITKLEGQNLENIRQRKALASNLEEASANLTKVRNILQDERARREQCEERLKRADMECTSSSFQIQHVEETAKRREGDLERLRGDYDALRTDHQRLQGETSRLVRELHVKEAAEVRVAALETELEQYKHQANTIRSLRRVVAQMSRLTQVLSHELRKELVQLKSTAMQQISGLETFCDAAINRLIACHRERVSLQSAEHRLEADTLSRNNQQLEQQLAESQSREKELTQQCALDREDADNTRLHLDRVLTAVSQYIPVSENIKEGMVSPRRCSHPESILPFKEEVARCVSEMREKVQTHYEEIVAQKESERARLDESLKEEQLQIANQEGAIQQLQQQTQALESRIEELNEVEQKASRLQERLEETENELRSERDKMAESQKTFERRSQEAQMLAEMNQADAQSSIKEQLRQLNKELGQLQTQHHEELARRDKELSDVMTHRLNEQRRDAEQREQQLQSTVDQLTHRLKDSDQNQKATRSTTDASIKELKDKLAATTRELDSVKRDKRALEVQLERHAQDRAGDVSMVAQLKRQVDELKQTHREELDQLDQARRKAVKEREDEMKKVHEAKRHQLRTGAATDEGRGGSLVPSEGSAAGGRQGSAAMARVDAAIERSSLRRADSKGSALSAVQNVLQLARQATLKAEEARPSGRPPLSRPTSPLPPARGERAPMSPQSAM
ncbi:unnamed protein product [Vitrella brassicaformis CCMP3155]|uniref:Uncharacterized protein n=2 Tax=Vitrella brassicaformis TaxID=1169539 RepID=A0A0G4F8W0_VITBC|nr:unnamed protein product [Vitrella brassicaformis CCMP3155]|eukprot:CEM09178.1 unnamed protein product [Vitrella brassicaformis CCMP3155]